MLLQAFEPTAHMLTYGALTVDRKPVENPPVWSDDLLTI